MPNDLKKFREAGVDAFTGGFQVGAARTTTDNRKTSHLWVNSKPEIKRILLTAFPNQATSVTQRKRAGRWLRVIHLYYRMGYTKVQIAEEMSTTLDTIKSILRNMNRARLGLKTNNGKPRVPLNPAPFVGCPEGVPRTHEKD
jgi:hypothetical protein